MACRSLTAAQGRAFGGLLSGTGFTNGFTAISNPVAAITSVAKPTAAINAIQSAAVSTISDPITELSTSAASTFISAGAGNEFLKNAVPSSATSLLGGSTDFLSRAASYSKTIIPDDMSSFTQIFDQADSISKISRSVMPSITRGLNTDFGAITDITKDFTDGGFLGEAFGNFNDLLTNGVSQFTGDVSSFASDLVNLGDFGDFSDLGNLMSPGQIANQIISKGAGDIGNIASTLENLGVPLDDLTNPIYANKIQSALNGITNLQDITDLQTAFGSNLNLNNLGDITDISKVLNNVSLPSFSELGSSIAKTSTGVIENLGQYGDMVSGLSDISDLSFISDATSLMDESAFNGISSFLGGGTGPDGSMLVRDIIGTAGGYVHDTSLPTFQQAMNTLYDGGTISTLSSIYEEAQQGVEGLFTEETSSGSGVFEITDPRSGSTFTSLDDFIEAKKLQLDAEYQDINSDSQPDSVKTYLASARTNYNNSVNQIVNEKTNINKTDIDFNNILPGHKMSLYAFSSRLADRGQDTNDTADMLERMASKNSAGDNIKMALAEGKNLSVYDKYGIHYSGFLNDEDEEPDQYTTS